MIYLMYTTPKSHFCLRRDYIYFQYYLININYLSLIVILLYIIEVKFIFISLTPTHTQNKRKSVFIRVKINTFTFLCDVAQNIFTHQALMFIKFYYHIRFGWKISIANLWIVCYNNLNPKKILNFISISNPKNFSLYIFN